MQEFLHYFVQNQYLYNIFIHIANLYFTTIIFNLNKNLIFFYFYYKFLYKL